MADITIDSRLIGRWESESSDPEQVTMEFHPDGTLLYIVHQRRKQQKILLTFATHSGVIVTDQPSEPRREETKYEIRDDCKLVLNYAGDITTYNRKR